MAEGGKSWTMLPHKDNTGRIFENSPLYHHAPVLHPVYGDGCAFTGSSFDCSYESPGQQVSVGEDNLTAIFKRYRDLHAIFFIFVLPPPKAIGN